MTNFGEHVGFIWSIAEILRGNYKQSEYGKVVLPFTVLRRLDCVLEPTKGKVLAQLENLSAGVDHEMRETLLNMAAEQNFHNTSPFTFDKLLDDPDNIAANLNNLINGFSDDAREIFIERFKLPEQVARLDKDNLLYMVVSRFAQADLHPDRVSNLQMGSLFEELIRRFSEQSNETAGEHFTPREVIRLMVNLLFAEDTDALTRKGTIRKLYDPACGTGGMLSVAEGYLRELNPDAHLKVYGQELNDESYATCKSDMMIKGQNARNIHPGNSMQEGSGLRNWQFKESGVRVICVTNITEAGIDFSKLEKYISTDEYKSSYMRFTVSKGDILLSISGNSWGKVAEYVNDKKVILNTSTIRINELNMVVLSREFIKWFLQSKACREQLNLAMTGACQPNFGPSHLKKVAVTVPPYEEQLQLIEVISLKINRLERLVEKAKGLMKLLKERRTALISAAVTGKIDVRNVA